MKSNDRKCGIGGSDIPVILGISPYKTPYELFLEKRGEGREVTTADAQTNIRLELGKHLEDFVIKRFEEQENVKVLRRQEKLLHSEHSFLWGTIDGAANDEIIEVKTTRSFNKDYQNGVPSYVLAQALYYAHLANAAGFKIITFFRDKEEDPSVYTFGRDTVLEQEIIEKAIKFWNNIQSGIAPEAANYYEMQHKFSKIETDKKVIATTQDLEAINELIAINTNLSQLEKRKEELKTLICKHMEDAPIMTDELGNTLVTWGVRKTCKLAIDKLKESFKEAYDQCRVIGSTRSFLLKQVN